MQFWRVDEGLPTSICLTLQSSVLLGLNCTNQEMLGFVEDRVQTVVVVSQFMFPSYSISYSQVFGRVVGYQFGSKHAVIKLVVMNRTLQHQHYYVDGISLTHGSSCQYILTFMAGAYDNVQNSKFNCPCTQGSAQTVQSFVGIDYF